MYRAGYDPQALIRYFERVEALQQRKPGAVAKVFAGHPQTPDRIQRTRDEIVRILPARAEQPVNPSEFDAVKARLERIEKERGLTGTADGMQP
jgi:predicted Zn-dependent protease